MKKIVAAKYTSLKFGESLSASDSAPECAKGYDVCPVIIAFELTNMIRGLMARNWHVSGERLLLQ